MENLILIMAVGVICIGCFLVGAKVGQKVVRGETINIAPPKFENLLKDKEDRKQAELEAQKLGTIMQNLEKYDGTSFGQEEV